MPADQPRFGKDPIDDLMRRMDAAEKQLRLSNTRKPHLPLADFSTQGTPFAQDGAITLDYRGHPLDGELVNHPRYSYGGVWMLLDSAEFEVLITSPTDILGVADAQGHFFITKQLAGLNLVEVAAFLITAGTTTTTIQLHNITTGDVDILSTRITMTSGLHHSYDAAVQPVINPLYDLMNKGDIIRVDVDTAGTGAKGLGIAVRFE